MLKLMSAKKAERVIGRYESWISAVSGRYLVPAAAIKAILFQEMTMIDAFDLVADLAVRVFPRWRKDSSTGYAQVFGYVGLNAVNFAVERGLATYGSLGFDANRVLDPADAGDVRAVWLKLHSSPMANIEIATLNLLVAADEMVGRLDFDTFTDEELKLVFTRYNANTKRITPYGEQVFGHYVRYGQ